MRRQTRVVHPRDRRDGFQATCAISSALSHCASHAYAQRFQALEHHPGVERSQRHAGSTHHGARTSSTMIFDGPQIAPGHHAALAIEVLGAGMNDEVGTELRPAAAMRRRAEAVVDCQQGTHVVCASSASAAMSHTSVSGLVGVSANSSLVLGRNAALPGGHVGLRHKGRLDTELAELAANQRDGRAEHRARADHVVTRLEQAHAHHEDGAHAGRCAYARLRCLQARPGGCSKAGDRGVGCAAVGVAVFGHRQSGVRQFRHRAAQSRWSGKALRSFRRTGWDRAPRAPPACRGADWGAVCCSFMGILLTLPAGWASARRETSTCSLSSTDFFGRVCTHGVHRCNGFLRPCRR